jgi:hypothetical protein
MARQCEVCRNFKPERVTENQTLVEVEFDARSVTLCRGHARIAANAHVRTFAKLRELFGSGRRSYIERRGPESATAGRKQRRKSPGRRAGDSVHAGS